MGNIQLIGHSGCKLQVLDTEKHGTHAVRKISSSVEYNRRLEKQMEKQASFDANPLRKPTIFEEGYTETGLYYFDMELIRGISFSDFIEKGDIKKVTGYFDQLLNFCFNNFDVGPAAKVNELIYAKFLTVQEKVAYLPKYIETYVMDNMHTPLEQGYCHGDLTFENIIVFDNHLYLIDFLDSYVDSPYIDYANIFQDLDLNWSNRNKKQKSFALSRRLALRSRMQTHVSDYLEKPLLDLHRVMKLLRILPYSNTETKLLIYNQIHKLIRI